VNAVERYLKARERMSKEPGFSIPNPVLRGFLDANRHARRFGRGLHPTVITVTPNPVTGILNWDVLAETETVIRVSGQHWDDRV
jgi:hypothetical protein